MSLLLDTNIVIDLRDGIETTLSRYARVTTPVAVSIVTVVELAGGIAQTAAPEREARRRLTKEVLEDFLILPFESPASAAYAAIVEQAGFARARVLDRMIAATALVAGMTVATANMRDFRDIPGLELEDWSN